MSSNIEYPDIQSVCRQVRRICIDEVNSIFDFLAIPAKQVSESGIEIEKIKMN